MFHNHVNVIVALILMTTASCASCSKVYYTKMEHSYEVLKNRVDVAYKNKKMMQDNFQYFSGTLAILKGYLDTYLSAVKGPVTLESPNQDQCESMEMQINDVTAGLTRVLDVEIPQQQVPHAPLAPRREARGPSPRQSMPKNILPEQSEPYVETPKSSLGRGDIPTPPMPVQKEPQQSTLNP